MRVLQIVGLQLTLCCASFAAVAGQPLQKNDIDIEQRLTAEQRHATGLDTLSTAQLQLLNRLLRDQAMNAALAAVPDDTSQSTPQSTPSHSPRAYIGLDDTPIHSRVKGVVSGWETGTVFVLENGQQWKVLKGSMTLRKPLQSPEIVVVPGIAGRWFLQVDEDMPKARVYRID